jgi:hypothetical protein
LGLLEFDLRTLKRLTAVSGQPLLQTRRDLLVSYDGIAANRRNALDGGTCGPKQTVVPRITI